MAIQVRPEHTLARDIKVVAIDQCVHALGLSRLELLDGGQHHAPDFDGLAVGGDDVGVDGLAALSLMRPARSCRVLQVNSPSTTATTTCPLRGVMALSTSTTSPSKMPTSRMDAPDAQQVTGLGVLDEFGHQVDALNLKILGGRWKPRPHLRGPQGRQCTGDAQRPAPTPVARPGPIALGRTSGGRYQEWAWQKNDRNTVGWQGLRGCGSQSNRFSWTKHSISKPGSAAPLFPLLLTLLPTAFTCSRIQAASSSGEIVFSRSVACGGHSTGMSADTVCLLPDEECHVRSL